MKKTKAKRRKEAPDWFGCGRVITTKSWEGFLAAQRAYYSALDAKESQKQKTQSDPTTRETYE